MHECVNVEVAKGDAGSSRVTSKSGMRIGEYLASVVEKIIKEVIL